MIIIPYAKFHEKMALPIATLILVIINIVAYNIQSRSDWRYEAAIELYVKSDLAQLEFPVLSQVEPRVFPRGSLGEPVLPARDDIYAYARIVNRSMFSEAFQTRLQNDDVLEKSDKQYPYWKSQRNDFNGLLKSVQILAYGFVPVERKWYTVITHQFVHSGLGHLIGNLIFLVMIGIALEGVIGFSLTLLLYLGTGTLSTVADYLARADSLVPSVGASGAISGLMGAFAVIYGFRWIRVIFFFLFPFFIRFSVPAALLLIYWLGVEILSYKYLRDESNINYIAHLGGLVSGALIAMAIRPLCRERLDAMD
jgi:membrane associated rhomboid family serine protease